MHDYNYTIPNTEYVSSLICKRKEALLFKQYLSMYMVLPCSAIDITHTLFQGLRVLYIGEHHSKALNHWIVHS